MTRDGDLITFEATKMKDGTRPAPITFGLRSVELGMVDDEGDAITSAVLDRTTPAPSARESREDSIRVLHGAGRSVREIAQKLSIGKSTVQRELDRLRHCPTVPPYRVVGHRDTLHGAVPSAPGQSGTLGTPDAAAAYLAASEGE